MDETFKFLKNSQNFAVDLYKATSAQNPASSVYISPLVAQSSAALFLMGTTGETALQLSSVLRLEHLSKNAIANHYASLISYLPVSLIGFTVSSKIFQSKRHKVKTEFSDVAVDKFFTEVRRVKFEDNVKSCKKINDWIEANLPRKAPGMVEANSFMSDTALLLASVSFFQGSWLSPFNLSLTSKQPFWVRPNESIVVNMMNTTARLQCAHLEELDAKAIELPFRGSEVTMVLLLPNEPNSLDNLEANLDQLNLSGVMDLMSEQYVNLSLPRFKLEACYKLHRKFLEMSRGSRMFTKEAELDAMFEGDTAGSQHLELLQRTTIEVNEKGINSYVAAGMTLTRKQTIRFQIPPPEFKANRPFLYVLKGGADTILFIGCVKNGKFC